ncbi:MAG: DUF779 domain-containing protein [Flavobacteriaceae bacterium]|jgi:uncharacterized protein (DUF779 family)|nr:DUF779 domain-containing protein [Flavobacteriaceae bacterium LSUCC0859]MCI4642826.1 DUF779 domain-containing protein [Flavobacteriaceae bacterium]MCI5088879.1 DUF779 domain-containing protein [Flavobacteriaceae bacterium]CAI8217648.1 MAG: Uncharacterised protein [SAR116 cluster bacterium]
MNRVAITDEAAEVVSKIREKQPDLIFHQSGGCCDGSSPMLLPAEDFYLDNSDILLGEIAGIKYYMNQDQFDYWKHTHLTVDITSGRGASFSLEIPLGMRFIIHSRLLNDKELDFFIAQ